VSTYSSLSKIEHHPQIRGSAPPPQLAPRKMWGKFLWGKFCTIFQFPFGKYQFEREIRTREEFSIPKPLQLTMGSLFSSRPMAYSSTQPPQILLLGGYQSGKRTFLHWIRHMYDVEPRDTPAGDQVILSENLKDSLHFLANGEIADEIQKHLSPESIETLNYIKTFSYIFLSDADMEKVLGVLRDPGMEKILTFENLRKWKKFTCFNQQLLQRLQLIGKDFANKDFVPSFDDTLLCSRNLTTANLYTKKTEKIVDDNMTVFGVTLCPGPRSLRHHWLTELQTATDIIFFCNLGEFDLTLREDPQTNRTKETLFIWKWLVTRKELRHCRLKILFTMPDLLRRKLEAGIQISEFVSTFASESKEPDAIAKDWVSYLTREFLEAAQKAKLNVTIEGPVSLLDTQQTPEIVKKLVGTKYLAQKIEDERKEES
jgi:hypothetical protein